MEHLPPNGMLQLVSFMVIYEALLGIEPNKDLFWWLFEVKSRWTLGSTGGALALWVG